MTSLIKEIPVEKNESRGWRVELNGKEVKKVSLLKVSHPNFGDLNYGLTAPGYDGWSFKEIGGGGVITIPYVVIDGQLMVGLVQQMRHNQGGKVWNAPRGFIDPGEKHFKSALRELSEEFEYVSPNKRVKPLEGEPTNSNSAFFETPKQGEGCRYFAIEILSSQIEKDEKGNLGIKADQMKPISKIAEQIFDCRFITWRTAVQVADQFTSVAVARLLACQLCR